MSCTCLVIITISVLEIDLTFFLGYLIGTARIAMKALTANDGTVYQLVAMGDLLSHPCSEASGMRVYVFFAWYTKSPDQTIE